jgi:hypothetical protein
LIEIGSVVSEEKIYEIVYTRWMISDGKCTLDT